MNVIPLRIADRTLGPGSPALVVAEIGLNHNGDPGLAETMIAAAADAGADAVKFQTFIADRLVSARSDAYGDHQASGSPVDIYRTYELPRAAYPGLAAAARARGVLFSSTPFDEESADMLVGLGMPFVKIASGDLTHIPLLRHVGRFDLPVMLATGMGTMNEIEVALAAIGHRRVVLLQCTSAYPCPPDAVDLRAMVAMRERFGLPVGLSDHTEGIGAAVAAVALGAVLIEKHFTSDRGLPGPDQKMSADPAQWRALTRAVREAEAALGTEEKRTRACEATTVHLARRSLVAARDLPAGHVLGRTDLAVKRPGTGLAPALLDETVGRTLGKPVARDQVLQENDLV